MRGLIDMISNHTPYPDPNRIAQFVTMLVDVENNGSLNGTDRDCLSNIVENPQNWRTVASR